MKTVLITGGVRGIGLAIAEKFLKFFFEYFTPTIIKCILTVMKIEEILDFTKVFLNIIIDNKEELNKEMNFWTRAALSRNCLCNNDPPAGFYCNFIDDSYRTIMHIFYDVITVKIGEKVDDYKDKIKEINKIAGGIDDKWKEIKDFDKQKPKFYH